MFVMLAAPAPLCSRVAARPLLLPAVLLPHSLLQGWLLKSTYTLSSSRTLGFIRLRPYCTRLLLLWTLSKGRQQERPGAGLAPASIQITRRLVTTA
jgi:hypothetical protein